MYGKDIVSNKAENIAMNDTVFFKERSLSTIIRNIGKSTIDVCLKPIAIAKERDDKL